MRLAARDLSSNLVVTADGERALECYQVGAHAVQVRNLRVVERVVGLVSVEPRVSANQTAWRREEAGRLKIGRRGNS